MKNLFSLILSGIFGGLIVLGGVSYFEFSKSSSISENQENQISQFVSYGAGNVPAPFDFTTAADKAMKAVVHIKASESQALAQQRNNQRNPFGSYDNPFKHFFGEDFDQLFGSPFQMQPRSGIGSGVIMRSDGFIVTNNHVVEFADKVEITLHDDRVFQAEIIGRDPSSDLAVLKIEETGLPTLKIGNSDEAKVGNWVLAVGNPFDLTSTVTAGIISAKKRDLDIINSGNSIESFIQTDAAVNPGNSGGALVNTEGDLIGINTAIYSRTGSYTGYSFAIPANIVSSKVDDIIKNSNQGRLGITVVELNKDIADELGLNLRKGVIVEELQQGGAAQFAGILPYDVITEVDGNKIDTFSDLKLVLNNSQAGDILNINVNRNGQNKKIKVRLKRG